MTEAEKPSEDQEVEDRWSLPDGPAHKGPISGLTGSAEGRDKGTRRAAGTTHLDGTQPLGRGSGALPPLPLSSGPLPRGTGPLTGTGPLAGSGPLPARGTGALMGSGPLPSRGTGTLEEMPMVLVPGVGRMRADDAARLEAFRRAQEEANAEPPAPWKPWKIAYLPPTVLAILGPLGLALCWWESWSPWLCVVAHLFLSVVVGLVWRPFGPYVAWRSFGVCLALPGVGSLAAWVAYMVERNELHTLTDSYREFVAFEPTWSAMNAVRDTEAALRTELSVRPYVEGLRMGDLSTKQRSAEALSAKPDGVATLRKALTDPDGEVRLFASLALVKAEEHRTADLAKAREHLGWAQSSGDGLAQAQLALGESLASYAASGLPDEDAVATLWGEALALAVELVGWPLEDPVLAQGYDLMARVALTRGMHEASLWCAKALSLGGPNEGRLLRAMEAHFLEGNLEGVQVLAKRLAEVAAVGDGADVARYWLKVQEQAPV